ncbi:MAG: hypothetical protein ACOYJA_06210 [Christensenellales bacterium]|jgi:hypothetical protein
MAEPLDKISPYLRAAYRLDGASVGTVETVAPGTLLSPLRLDLGAKLYYIRCRVQGRPMSLARDLYDAHIQAFQDGIVVEPGQRDKVGLEAYRRRFDQLIDSFAADDFDPERAYLPVDGRGMILDGAHRLACAVYFDQPVRVMRLPQVQGHPFGYWFFRSRGLDQERLRAMAAALAAYLPELAVGEYPKSRSLRALRRRQLALYYACQADGGCRAVIRQPPGDPAAVASLLDLAAAERVASFSVSAREARRCRWIRAWRRPYTGVLLWVKRRLGMPT